MNPWQILNIEPTVDLRIIKRAYSVKLKQHKPDVDPEGYQQVRDAFDQAKRIAKNKLSSVNPQDNNHTSSTLDEPLKPLLFVEREESSDSSHTEALIFESDHNPLINEQSPNEHIVQNKIETISLECEESIPTKDQTQSINVDEFVRSLVNSLHDTLIQESEVAAINQFSLVLKSEDLISIDVSKQFEMHLMEYLNWWAEQYAHNSELEIPAGMIRLIVREYGWHTKTLSLYQQLPHLENLFETIVSNSGESYLKKIADGSTKSNNDFRKAAKILLGKYRPITFQFKAMSPTRSDAIYKLISNIEGLNDSSFQFELNTDTVNWWIKSKTSFLLTWWMALLGFFISLVPLALVAESVPSSSIIVKYLGPLPIMFVIFVGAWIFSSAAIYMLCYFLSILLKRIDAFFNTISVMIKEIVSGLVAVSIVLMSGFLLLTIPELNEITVLVVYLLLAIIYRSRVLTFPVFSLALIVAYEMKHGGLAFQALTFADVLCPVLIINSLVCVAYLASNKNQLNSFNEINRKTKLLLGFTIMILCCVYGTIVLQK